jgi:hypothetical protein
VLLGKCLREVFVLLAFLVLPASSLLAQASPSVPQVIVTCNNQLSISMDGKWNDAWKDAKIVDVLPIEGAYRQLPHRNGYDYSGFMCDDKWFYGYVEYITPQEIVKSPPKPHSTIIFLDTKDDKNYVPQNDDYRFILFHELARDVFHGLYYHQGTGNPNDHETGWQSYPGAKVYDRSFADSATSLISTPTFSQLHPFFEFKLSRQKLNLNGTIGLGILTLDDTYWGSYPLNDLGDLGHPNIAYHPNVWADVSLVKRNITTSTVQTTTSTSVSSTAALSTSSTATIASQQQVLTVGLSSFEWIWMIPVAVAVAGLLAYRTYRRRKRSV